MYALCRQGAGTELPVVYVCLGVLFKYDMNDADEPCQDLGRGLGSRKTGLSPLVIVLLTVPRRCSWYGSYLSDLKQVIFK